MFASKIFCAISTGSEELKTGSPLRSNNCISAGTFEGTTINVSIICSGTGTFKSGTTKSLASPSQQTGLFQPTGTTPLKSQKELTSGTKTFSSGTGTFKSSETTTFPSGTGTFKSGTTKSLASPSPQTGLFQPTGTTPLKSQKELTSGTKTFSSGTGTFKSSETTTFPSGTGTFKSALAVFSSAG